ncbi:MAG: formate dehydrogenase [Burkholderiales bacterium]
MSDKAGDTTPLSPSAPASPLKRRGLLVGAGTAGAALIAAKVMPGAAPVVTTAAVTAAKVVDTGGGYQVTAHVLRYYETTRA